MKGNVDLCFLILRSLADIDKLINYKKIEDEDDDDDVTDYYTNPININPGEKDIINRKLEENNKIVKKFIVNIYKSIGNITGNEKYKNGFIFALFDAIRVWAAYDLNIFKNEELAIICYDIMNNYQIKNPEKFKNLILESISYSKNSKIYNSIDTNNGETPEQLSQKIFMSIDKEEKRALDLLIKFLFPKLDNIKNHLKDNNEGNITEENRKLNFSYLSILESIIENYIYLFFNFSDENSIKLLEYIQFFLKCKKKKLSSFFIEGIMEMRNFINNFYHFVGLNDGQKLEFINYFMDIFLGVLENCTYKNFSINNISLLDVEILTKNSCLNVGNSDLYNIEYKKDLDDYDDGLMEDISVDSYRNDKFVGEVFLSIYFIFLENFGDEKSASILENKIISILYKDNIRNNPAFPLIFDAIIFALSSISEIFDVEEFNNTKESWNVIKNVIINFIDAGIIKENQGILIDFMILIKKTCSLLGLEQDIYYKVIKFLLDISHNSNNEKIVQSCYSILSEICSYKNENIQDDYNLFNYIFKLFIEKYPKYDDKNISQIEYLLQIIFLLLGIKRNSNINISQEKLKFISDKISTPINLKIIEFLENYESNINNQKYKKELISEINKCYLIEKEIILKLKDFNDEIKFYYIQQYLEEFLKITDKILDKFYDNDEVMKIAFDFYKTIADESEGNFQNFESSFDKMNKLFFSFIISEKGDKNFKFLLILRTLYLSLFKSVETNNQIFKQFNNYIIEYYFNIVQYFIKKISKNDCENRIYKLLELFQFHSYIFPKLLLDHNYSNNIEEIIIFLINCVELLRNLENNGKYIDEFSLIYLLKSFNVIFSKETFVNNNRIIDIYSDLNNSINSTWNIIYFKNFNATSRSNLITFFLTAFKFDINNFSNIFGKLIENKFPRKYLENIINYLRFYTGGDKDYKDMIEAVIMNINGNQDLRKIDFFSTKLEFQKMKNKKNN